MSSSISFTACVGCRADSVGLILDFGRQPPSNRFFRPADPPRESHALALGACKICGLTQLIHPMPADMVRAHHSWLRYNEPENHLDQMTDDVIRICRLDNDACIFGLSYKDDSTLKRFQQRGFADTHRFDPRTDLGMEDPLAGLESIGEAMTAERAAWLVSRHGLADVLLVRHVLEHVPAPLPFLGALAQLLKPTGHLVIEVPESTKFLAACDYCFVWEEHISYFTAHTVQRVIQNAKLRSSMTLTYDYPLEDSLIVVAGPGLVEPSVPALTATEADLTANFGSLFAATRERLFTVLSSLKREGKRVALFGAGHLAVKFLNLFGLKDLIYCVIDDNADKIGLCMPGSALPVRPSSVLIDEAIDVCLLSVSPESENRVMSARHDYTSWGGRFVSIFALSPISYLRAFPSP